MNKTNKIDHTKGMLKTESGSRGNSKFDIYEVISLTESWKNDQIFIFLINFVNGTEHFSKINFYVLFFQGHCMCYIYHEIIPLALIMVKIIFLSEVDN